MELTVFPFHSFIPSKAKSPIDVTDCGITTNSIGELPKAPFPIVSKDLGREMLFKFEHPSKA